MSLCEALCPVVSALCGLFEVSLLKTEAGKANG